MPEGLQLAAVCSCPWLARVAGQTEQELSLARQMVNFLGSTGPMRSSNRSSSLLLRHTQTRQLVALPVASSTKAKIASAPVLSGSSSAEDEPPKPVTRVSLRVPPCSLLFSTRWRGHGARRDESIRRSKLISGFWMSGRFKGRKKC